MLELLPLIGGGVFGSVIKLISLRMQDSAEKHKHMMNALMSKNNINQSINENANKNNRFSMTRQIIALSVLSVVVGSFWIGGTVNIPIEIKEGTSYLFGLISSTVSTVEYTPISGRVVLQDILPAFQAIMGTYIGASLSDRR